MLELQHSLDIPLGAPDWFPRQGAIDQCNMSQSYLLVVVSLSEPTPLLLVDNGINNSISHLERFA